MEDESRHPCLSIAHRSHRMASQMETAVDAADDLPHFLMSAPPRPATVGTNDSSSHVRSLITSTAGLPQMRALTKSGT